MFTTAPGRSHLLAPRRGQRDQRSFLLRSFMSITVGGAIIVTISAALGAAH